MASVVFEKVCVILDIAGTSPAQYDRIKDAFFLFFASDTTHIWTYFREADVMFQWLSHEQGKFQVKVNLDKCPTLVALICNGIVPTRSGKAQLLLPSRIWAKGRCIAKRWQSERKKLMARKLPPELVSMIWKSM